LYCILFEIHVTNAHKTVIKARYEYYCLILSIVVNAVNRVKQTQCSKFHTKSNKVLHSIYNFISPHRAAKSQTHNTQHNTIILNQTLKKRRKTTVNEEHTHTRLKITKIQSIKQIFTRRF